MPVYKGRPTPQEFESLNHFLDVPYWMVADLVRQLIEKHDFNRAHYVCDHWTLVCMELCREGLNGGMPRFGCHLQHLVHEARLRSFQ